MQIRLIQDQHESRVKYVMNACPWAGWMGIDKCDSVSYTYATGTRQQNRLGVLGPTFETMVMTATISFSED